MRLASWDWGGRPHVGTVSADGRDHATRSRCARRCRGPGRCAASSAPGATTATRIEVDGLGAIENRFELS